MSADTPLSGPDLAAGINAAQLAPGETLLGHAHGDAVLLARVGDEYFAIGATCTHYSGPLADGVVHGDQVRCPWHHACFSLRTGEALRAPALSPVPCYQVERRGERVVVGQKVERDPLAPTYPVRVTEEWPRQIVIVGAGAAGAAATEMLRRCGYDHPITVIDDDLGSPYDRPNLSKDYLAGNAPEEWIPLRPADFYARHDVHIVRGLATRVDVDARMVHATGHAPVKYDALLLATGAEPIRLELEGADQPHVHYLRTLVNSRAIVEASKHAKTVVVVGASFIGLEVAASLRARGLTVHVAAPEKIPLARVLGDQLGAFVRSLHEEHGVVFHLGRTARKVDESSVTLDDGTRLDADLVVIGAGVRPRTQVAEQAGLALDRGVLVNEYLETSVSGIYAAGDIARWPDAYSGEPIRVEHWVLAERHGQTAARNILGAREKFTEAPFFWSAHYDVSFNYVGHAEQWDRIEIDGDPAKHDVSARFLRDGKLAALVTLFRDQESLKAELAMEQGVR
jgi:NADPH-dependent 2,4-dienoyl-CoA reductase/sulfur reductase-like enzyme/nitrite reductase/ring-hydroxylating ferredoxin subunit